MQDARIHTEDILTPWGFRLVWEVKDHWADVRAYEIAGISEEGDAVFLRENWTHSGEQVEDLEEAEKYLEGFVKWDGCTELNQGQPHWCGPAGYKKHMALLEHIYKRAHELMGREPEEPWEDVSIASDTSSTT